MQEIGFQLKDTLGGLHLKHSVWLERRVAIAITLSYPIPLDMDVDKNVIRYVFTLSSCFYLILGSILDLFLKIQYFIKVQFIHCPAQEI